MGLDISVPSSLWLLISKGEAWTSPCSLLDIGTFSCYDLRESCPLPGKDNLSTDIELWRCTIDTTI